jgi:hypothetical protein
MSKEQIAKLCAAFKCTEVELAAKLKGLFSPARYMSKG